MEMKDVERQRLKREFLDELEREKDFIDWSVELGSKAKKGRFNELISKSKS